mmetsp:Transcript_13727/g.35323  ORF Transcript_13727/g.35323 Transcript_13727/m.35323 type:complete len:211 (-) Transcript_13727:434-1066(-)
MARRRASRSSRRAMRLSRQPPMGASPSTPSRCFRSQTQVLRGPSCLLPLISGTRSHSPQNTTSPSATCAAPSSSRPRTWPSESPFGPRAAPTVRTLGVKRLSRRLSRSSAASSAPCSPTARSPSSMASSPLPMRVTRCASPSTYCRMCNRFARPQERARSSDEHSSAPIARTLTASRSAPRRSRLRPACRRYSGCNRSSCHHFELRWAAP